MQRAIPAGFRGGRPSSPRARAHLALLGHVVLWGSVGIAVKVAERDGMPPITLALLRCLVAALVLLPLVYRSGDRPALGRGPAVLGLTGSALFYTLYNEAMRFSTVDNAMMFRAVVPAITLVLAAALLHEALGRRRVIGTLLSIGGLAGLVLIDSETGLEFSALGDLLMLGAYVGLAVYNVAGRRVFAGQNLLAVVAGSSLYGALFLAPAAGLELARNGADSLWRVPWEEAALVLYLGAGCTALGLVLLGVGLQQLGAGEVAVFGNLIPIVAIALAAIFLGETMGATEIAAGVVITAGIWLASSSPRAEPATNSARQAASTSSPLPEPGAAD